MNHYHINELERLESFFCEAHPSIREVVDKEIEFYKAFNDKRTEMLKLMEIDGMKIDYARIDGVKNLSGTDDTVSFAAHLFYKLCEPFVDKNGFASEYKYIDERTVISHIEAIGYYDNRVNGLHNRLEKGIVSLRKGLFLTMAKPIYEMNFEIAKSATSTLVRYDYIGSERQTAINIFTNYSLYGKQTHFDSKMEATKFVHKIEGIKRTYKRALESEAK